MKNKFIAQKITAIQRYMPLGFLLLSAFNFICFASAAILENAQQITQNPLSDDPIAPRIIILAVVWGSIFIGSILVFLFPSPNSIYSYDRPQWYHSDNPAPECRKFRILTRIFATRVRVSGRGCPGFRAFRSFLDIRDFRNAAAPSRKVFGNKKLFARTVFI